MYRRSSTLRKKRQAPFLSSRPATTRRKPLLATLMPRCGSYDLNQFFPLSNSRDREISPGFIIPIPEETSRAIGDGMRGEPGEIASLVPASRCYANQRVYGVSLPGAAVSASISRRKRDKFVDPTKGRWSSRRGFVSRRYRERGKRTVALRAKPERRDSDAPECNSYRDDDNVQSRRACDHIGIELIYELSP